MKKLLALLAVAGFLGGCASTQPVGALYSGGNFYNGATVVDANKDVRLVKTGKSCATSVLSLVATGDNSVAAAKRNGMITKVGSIDYDVMNVLGIYGQYCTVVKGE
ncbi:MAG: TRL-like family protein [Neisseriaceae bacterium]